MTFLEAALEVLRHAQDPLHFGEIARRAVSRNLLSHVGRDPEAAMRSCLTSAVRNGAHDEALERVKPGVYQLRSGAVLPELELPPDAKGPEEEDAPEAEGKSKGKKTAAKKRKRTAKKTGKKATKKAAEEKPEEAAEASEDPPASEEPALEEPSDPAIAAAVGKPKPADDDDRAPVEFEAPEGSGLDGVTDVALVMANAMSRLAEERPELREELEAMQQQQQAKPAKEEGPTIERRSDRGRVREDRPGREDNEERGGRRRRRRRRRSRRVEWADSGSGASPGVSAQDALLDRAATVLDEAGPRSLHVRQIAETLAAQDVLGGDISEIERAVTCAILLDVRARGRASRFTVRGDARYQLQSSRVPEAAGSAEKALHAAIARVERETKMHLLQWVQALGARALESLVRIYLDAEGYRLVSTLPPARGLAKLVVEDPDPEEGRQLVLVVPRKTSLDPRQWEGEADRNNCNGTIVFAAGDGNGAPSDARVISANEFTGWLAANGVGVETMTVSLPVLDAALIESIGGLDT